MDTLKLTLALASLLVSTPVLAADWQPLGADTQETVLIDASSLRADGDEILVRLVRDYRSEQLSMVAGKLYRHRSQAMVYAVDCTGQQIRHVEWSLHAENLGAGRTVAQGKPRGAAYTQDLRRSGESAMVATVCGTHVAGQIPVSTALDQADDAL
jgi:hypothetical protein